MATWMKCTEEDGTAAYINLDNVAWLFHNGVTTAIFMVGASDGDRIVVSETPQQITGLA